MSCQVSAGSDLDISARAIATPIIKAVPPRRRASSALPIAAALLSAPIATTSAGGPIRAGTASSQ